MSSSTLNNIEIKAEGHSKAKAFLPATSKEETSYKNSKRPSSQLHTVLLRKKVKIPDRPILLKIKHTYDTEVIDLTIDDDTPSMEDIRRNNGLFFMYDPHGIWANHSKPGYCSDCGCPQTYCGNIVFGRECMIRSEYILVKKRKCDVDKVDVLNTLSRVYSEVVQAKARNNMISEEMVEESYDPCLLPNCIMKNTASLLIKKVTDFKDNNGSIIWSPCKSKWMNRH